MIEVDSLDLYSARVFDAVGQSHPSTAYLQYTSGSTRTPAGVIVSHRNVIANLEQAAVVYFEDYGNTPPPGLRWVSWLPFHHDMGLFFTLFIPIYAGNPISFITPVAFLQRPARWMQLLGKTGLSYSCAPNFAFDLAARRTSDHDMDGIDLGGVLAIINGAERVHPATIKRFNERFARFNLKENGDTTVLRTRRGHLVCGGSQDGPAGEDRPICLRAVVGRTGAGMRQRRYRRYRPRQLRPARGGTWDVRGADRQPGHLEGESAGNDRRNLGARGQRGNGVLGEIRGNEPNLRCQNCGPLTGTPDGSW